MNCIVCELFDKKEVPAVVAAMPPGEERFSFGLCSVHARERFRHHRFSMSEFHLDDVLGILKEDAKFRKLLKQTRRQS